MERAGTTVFKYQQHIISDVFLTTAKTPMTNTNHYMHLTCHCWSNEMDGVKRTSSRRSVNCEVDSDKEALRYFLSNWLTDLIFVIFVWIWHFHKWIFYFRAVFSIRSKKLIHFTFINFCFLSLAETYSASEVSVARTQLFSKAQERFDICDGSSLSLPIQWFFHNRPVSQTQL